MLTQKKQRRESQRKTSTKAQLEAWRLSWLVEGGLGGGEGVGGAEVRGEGVLEVADGVLELLAGLRDGVEDLVLVDGGAAGEQGGGDGDADASRRCCA